MSKKILVAALAGRPWRPGEMISWRYEKAIQIARACAKARHYVDLAHVGDGAGKPSNNLAWGTFNKQALAAFREAGFQGIAISNGDCLENANTKGDMRALAEFLRCKQYERVIVVTCWYHVPRTLANWRHVWLELDETPPPLSVKAVWRDIRRGLRGLPGELHGALDALRGKPQNSRRSPVHLRS